jgi:hypothetical protein
MFEQETRMEGDDGTHPFHSVDVAARFQNQFSQQSAGRRIAEQQQALGLGERDVLPGSGSAVFQFL